MPCHCGKRSPCKVQVYKPVVLKLDDTLEPLEVDLPCQLVSVEQTQVSQSSRFPGQLCWLTPKAGFQEP